MWKSLIVALLPLLAQTYAHVIIPEDEVIKGYKTSRALLTPEQEEFLTELLAADDALIESASRGIVDEVLQAISGAGNGIRVNVVGGAGFGPTPASAQSGQAQPAVNIINPTFTVVGMGQEKALLNTSNANAVITQAVTSALSGGSYFNGTSSGSAPVSAAQTQGNVTTIGGNNNHLFSTISQVIRNSNTRNVTGIVDQSLRIATPAPIREFVTGLLNVVYCNSIRRLLGRC